MSVVTVIPGPEISETSPWNKLSWLPDYWRKDNSIKMHKKKKKGLVTITKYPGYAHRHMCGFQIGK